MHFLWNQKWEDMAWRESLKGFLTSEPKVEVGSYEVNVCDYLVGPDLGVHREHRVQDVVLGERPRRRGIDGSVLSTSH